MVFEAGSSIDRYHLEALIGEGGMGRVFRAHDSRLHRRVAVKIVSAPEAAGPLAAEAASRLLREARAAAAFNHPNVVSIYDVGEADGTPFIAMELVEGVSLRAYVGDQSVPTAQKIAWLLDVARGLGAAHRAGLVHRDIKPENVVITPEGLAKILDFGIARRADAQQIDPSAPTSAPNLTAVTAEGIVIGTPQYMAPEQLRGDPLDGRCDQFAWGVTAYELLAGRLPWKAITGVQLVAALLDPHAPRLQETAPHIDSRIAAAVDHALQGARQARFATMEELVAFVVGSSQPVVIQSSRDVAAKVPSEPFARTELATTTPPRPTRDWRRRAVVLGAIVGIVAIGAFTAAERWSARAPALSASAASAAPSASDEAKLPTGAAARAAYQAALQSFRDGRSNAWRHNLEAVVAADPGFGAAYFWLAFLWLGDNDATARSYYAKAVQHRSSLGEIDAALLEATEPRLRDPPDRAERLARMERLGSRYPRDTTVQYMLGLAYLSVHRYDDATAAFDRTLAVDPAFAFGYQNEIFIAQYKGDVDRWEKFVDRCLSACPSSTDCRLKRMELDNLRGACTAVMAGGRAALASDTSIPEAYEMLASAMASLGEPRAGVAEMLRRANETETERLEFYEHEREVYLDVSYGDFRGALRASAAAEATFAGHPEQSPIATQLERLGILIETGDLASARTLAASLRARIGGWEGADSPSVMTLSGYERHAGLIPGETLRARREAWMRARAETRQREGSQREPFWDWELAYAATAEGHEDAVEALEALDKYGPAPPGALIDLQANAGLGHVYTLAGRFADALQPLRTATRSCNGLQWPRDYMQASYDLGVSLEGTGDIAGARKAYGTVLDRWGSAQPRSVTADAVRARMKRLGD
jgi:serine/threonine-protein kinase